jgi:subtilisin family serine protease
VINSHRQTTSQKHHLRLSVTVCGLLLLLMLAATLLWPNPSGAARTGPAPGVTESADQKRRRPAFVPGEALVRFKKNRAFEGSTIARVPGDESQPNALRAATVPVTIDRFAGAEIVDGLRVAHMAPADTLTAVAALNAREDVLYAEPNYLLHIDATPNDPSFGQLYGLNLIGAQQAWDTTTGNRNIVVAVIDEGVDRTHTDLQANIWTNPSPGSISGISGDVNGYDFRDNTGTIVPETHATHVAGTIGAVGNNNTGVVGVNWQVSLMSLRFISAATNNGTDADAIKAYNYVKQMRDLWASSGHTKGADIRVVNASYGGGGYSQAAAEAINALGQAGVLFVAAAGNETSDADAHPHYPSGYSLTNVISVASTTSTDNLSSFSNFGAHTVLMGAPGSSILSTTPGDGYGTLSGTSMATPHVAGAAALLAAANSNLTVNQLRALLAFNGDSITELQGKSLTGRRLNVFKSLQALNENDLTPPGTVAGFQIASQNGRSLKLTWSASGDDGTAGQASLYEISFVDQTTNAVVPLTSVAPASSGAPQTIKVNIPYRHVAGTIRLREFDNVGNEGSPATIAVNVHPNFADPYTTALAAHDSLANGGTALGLSFDDRYQENYPLPFSFSFYGQLYTSVTISTNGSLYFSAPPKRSNNEADDVPSSIADLGNSKMIAGMWDDLDLRQCFRANADVYVIQPAPGRIIFRWQGVPFTNAACPMTPFTDPNSFINFEIELNANGAIKTRYGDGNVNLKPIVGIANGESDPYVIDQLTSELSPKTLTNAQNAVFTPRASVQITSATFTVNEGAGHADITLSRSGDLSSTASVALTTTDTAGTQTCATTNGKASSRCDYTTTLGTVQFADGEAGRTITIPIVDDAYDEPDETFTVSIDNGSGTSLGAQTSATVTIVDNDSANGTSPLTATSFFVRQHYLDFLNREPDSAGLAFWIDNIDKCTDSARRPPGLTQAQCIEVQRINTSASFFISIEFQETGYLVERLYKSAFGEAVGNSTIGGSHSIFVPVVRLTAFLADAQRLGQGVVVNQGNWQQQLEDNKQAFIEDFVQRPTFVAALPASLTPAQFVDKLNDNAKDAGFNKPLSQAERDQLINDLTTGTKTRAQVLRAVAEDIDLRNSEFNRAFVLMEYFGYLRRNPNDAPEINLDYSGYEFWLNKLNQFHGNFVDAEMVKAFLTSIEYGERFSP